MSRQRPSRLLFAGGMTTALLIACLPVSAGGSGETVDPALDRYLTAAAELNGLSGAVLVARGDTVLLRKGYGLANRELDIPNTPDTKFRIGSITKTFTAAAIMLLQQRGQLDVRQRVCAYLPACPPAWRDVTLHHLLTHTSGIPNYMALPDYAATMRNQTDPAGLIARFQGLPLEFASGTQYRYSNSGYVLLGSVIERVSGTGYAQFLRAGILNPLGLANTGYDTPFRILKHRADGYSQADDAPINAPFIAMSVVHSAGALFSTVDDLHTWARAVSTDRILTPSLREAMLTPVKGGYGYGWGIDTEFGRRRVGHTGQVNGFTAGFFRFPDDGVTVVVLTNSDQTVPGIKRLTHDLAAIVFGEPYELPKPLKSIPVEGRVLDAYAGTYETGGAVIGVARTRTGLTIQLPGSFPYGLRAESESTFAIDVIDAKLTFVRAADGTVTELVLHQETEVRAKKKLPGL